MRLFECNITRINTIAVSNFERDYFCRVIEVELFYSELISSYELKEQLGELLHENLKVTLPDVDVFEIVFEYIDVTAKVSGDGCYIPEEVQL